MEYDQTPEIGEVDALLNTLAHEQCRTVIAYFRERDDHVATLDEIASYVTDNGGRERTGGADDAVTGRLHHATLPRLADAGLLEYDARSHTVRYHGHPRLETLLARIDE